MSTYLGRIGPLQVGSFAFRQRYLAIYEDALVYLRLNRWEGADVDNALLVADNLLVAGVMTVASIFARVIGTRRNKAVLSELGPQELAARHRENWVVWAHDVTEIAVFRSYDVGNSRRLRLTTPEQTREFRYSYACGPDEGVSEMLRRVVGTRFRLIDGQ